MVVPYSITTDCSGFVTTMAEWSKMPDSNGLNYNGSGNTGTMLSHLPHIPFNETWRGDLCVFGGEREPASWYSPSAA